MFRICYDSLSFGYNYLCCTPTLKEEHVHAIMPYVGSGELIQFPTSFFFVLDHRKREKQNKKLKRQKI